VATLGSYKPAICPYEPANGLGKLSLTHVFANVLNLKLRSRPSPLLMRAQRPPRPADASKGSRALTSAASSDCGRPQCPRPEYVLAKAWGRIVLLTLALFSMGCVKNTRIKDVLLGLQRIGKRKKGSCCADEGADRRCCFSSPLGVEVEVRKHV
jgi:hypothetical protein